MIWWCCCWRSSPRNGTARGGCFALLFSFGDVCRRNRLFGYYFVIIIKTHTTSFQYQLLLQLLFLPLLRGLIRPTEGHTNWSQALVDPHLLIVLEYYYYYFGGNPIHWYDHGRVLAGSLAHSLHDSTATEFKFYMLMCTSKSGALR